MKTSNLKFLVLITLFFAFSCQKEELFVQEDSAIYSQSLLARMSKLDGIRAKRKYAAECRWKDEE